MRTQSLPDSPFSSPQESLGTKLGGDLSPAPDFTILTSRCAVDDPEVIAVSQSTPVPAPVATVPLDSHHTRTRAASVHYTSTIGSEHLCHCTYVTFSAILVAPSPVWTSNNSCTNENVHFHRWRGVVCARDFPLHAWLADNAYGHVSMQGRIRVFRMNGTMYRETCDL